MVIEGAWAKLKRDADKVPIAALPLIDHGLDVAAAMMALRAGGAWDHALTQAAGRALTERDWARIFVLAALHDIGKANSGFHRRSVPGADIVGHEGEVSALLRDIRLRGTPAAQALRAIERDWGAVEYLPALMAHHGRPRARFSLHGQADKGWEKDVQYWRPAKGYDPAAEAMRLIDAVRARWPLAWDAGEPLPQVPAFVALFAGLVVLADWIGSDERRFPVAGPHGEARDAVRQPAAAAAIAARGLAALATPPGDFEQAFAIATPSEMQLRAATETAGPVMLIESETGSGKTEAALWRWLALRRQGLVDGLFFALPTRSAAVQIHQRVDRMLRRLWGDAAPEAVLAVPGYLRVGEAEGQALPRWEVRWDDRPPGDDSRWSAERSDRFLTARVAVGTIDQALMGAVCIRHAPVRATALARSLLVVDEVHASDAYMGQLLQQLLANHAGAGGHALLLSATLGAAARARLLHGAAPSLADAVAAPYPALTGADAVPRAVAARGTDKRVAITVAPLIADADAIAARAVAAARAGASVLVVRNSVDGAVAVAQAVEAAAPELAFRVEGVATVHHGRFAQDDRRLLDAAVEAAFGKGRTAAGRILVGTQTLEQSLDIDADLMLTDLAPMDVLLQRIGRLHRHARTDRGAFADAQIVVLRPAERDLIRLLDSGAARHGLGSAHGPYPDILQLEGTLRLLEGDPVVAIPADNRRLVEGALHPDVRAAIKADGGVAWANHAAERSAAIGGAGDGAAAVSLNLSRPFREHLFPDRAEAIATRLGARDLLVDLDPAPAGPFGRPVTRIAIPAWMAGGVSRDDAAVVEPDGAGWHLRLGARRFRYDRWGLARAD